MRSGCASPETHSGLLANLAFHCACDPAIASLLPNHDAKLAFLKGIMVASPGLCNTPNLMLAHMVCAAVQTLKHTPPFLRELFQRMDRDGAECAARDPMGFVMDKARVARAVFEHRIQEEQLLGLQFAELSTGSAAITPRRALKHIAMTRYDEEFIGE